LDCCDRRRLEPLGGSLTELLVIESLDGAKSCGLLPARSANEGAATGSSRSRSLSASLRNRTLPMVEMAKRVLLFNRVVDSALRAIPLYSAVCDSQDANKSPIACRGCTKELSCYALLEKIQRQSPDCAEVEACPADWV